MITVLSPAKTLDFESSVQVDTFTQPHFLSEAGELAAIAAQLTPDQLGELMNINGELSQLNATRFETWRQSKHDTPGEARQALLVFKGEVYRGLDAAGLDIDDIDFAQKHLRILSGLYGLLRPLDLMLPYRLEMGSRLRNSRGETLYDFWEKRLATRLQQEISEQNGAALINLASREYMRAIPPGELDCPIITPVFQDQKEQRRRTIGVYAKRQRGRMARYIAQHRITDPEGLKGYRDDGYRFRADLSDERTWTFLR